MGRAEQPVCHLLPPSMADDQKTAARDAERINVASPSELRYWAEQFGVTEREIREAVKVAGSRVRDVRARLAANRSY